MKLPRRKPPTATAGAARAAGRSRRWAGNLGLLTLSTALALLAAEGVVQGLLPQQPILIRPDVWQPHDGLGWVQAPNLDTRINTGEREVRLLTDAAGHRIGPDPRPEATYRVLALGDSYQAALQVEHEQTFTALLERRLTRDLGAPVEVVNAAVAGWGPSHYLLKARSELARRRYDLVVVFFYLGNDVEKRRIERFGPKTSTVHHRFRWPRQAARKEIVESLLYPVNDFLETRSHLFLLFRNRLWFVLRRAGLSARHFPPVLLKEEADAERWQVSADVCRSIADESAERGVPVAFVLVPGICEVDRQIAEITARAAGYEPQEIDPDQPSRRMTRELESLGLTVVDTTPALRAAHAAGRRDLFGRVDVHLDVGGHRAVADTVVPHLLAALDRRVEEAAGREGAGSPAPPGDRVAQRQAPARAQTLTERLLPPF